MGAPTLASRGRWGYGSPLTHDAPSDGGDVYEHREDSFLGWFQCSGLTRSTPGETPPMRVQIIPVEATEGLPLPARAVLAEITGYANREGYAWPAITTLAKRLGVTTQTVYKWRRLLVERGLLVKVGGGYPGRTAVYRLTWMIGRATRRAANLLGWRKGKRTSYSEPDLKVGGGRHHARPPSRQRSATPQPPSFAEVMARQAALCAC
jgi:DNA-binding MarR family transcriptional regulator